MADSCDHRIEGQHRCGHPDAVRLYLTGHRCPEHTPARLAGRAEPPTDTPGSVRHRVTATPTPNAT